jgi:hypothetical protein
LLRADDILDVIAQRILKTVGKNPMVMNLGIGIVGIDAAIEHIGVQRVPHDALLPSSWNHAIIFDRHTIKIYANRLDNDDNGARRLCWVLTLGRIQVVRFLSGLQFEFGQEDFVVIARNFDGLEKLEP